MTDATVLLNAVRAGDADAANRLIPLVYQELRRIARARLAHEPADQTLVATDLVHEAYIRLIGSVESHPWENRDHFFGAAVEVAA